MITSGRACTSARSGYGYASAKVTDMTQQGQDIPNATRALMPTMPKTNRRRFLLGAGALFGIAVGYAMWPRHPRLNLPVRDDEAMISGWVKIGADGRVVVVVPQAEMGQGVYTSLPMLVAEELGAKWESVSVEPAPLHPLYINTAITAEAVKGFPAMLQGAAQWTMGEMVERYAVQITGGSTSVVNFHESLRLAGATARDLLRKAAARIWSVDWEDVTVSDGLVRHAGKSLRFADVAGKAGEEDAPSSPKLKTRDAYKIIGKDVPRLDIPAKVKGTATFGLDVRVPEMVYAALRQGPVEEGRLANYDRAAVAASAGVLGVVEGDNWLAVVAERYWLARKQIDAMRVEFTDRASEKINTDWVKGRLKVALANGTAHVYEESGDLAAGMKADGKTLTADYDVPYLAHACMEPMNATARFNPDGTLDIWAPTQSITLVVMNVASAVGIEQEKIRVYPTFLGGGFGRKAETDACVQAAIIAREIKRPVQVIWSREQDMQQDKFRPMAQAKLIARLSPKGRIIAWHHRSASQSASGSFMERSLPAIATHEPDNSSVQGATGQPYDFGDVRVEHVMDKIAIPVGFWRSVGHSQNAFFTETFIDELAAEAKQDPLKFRLAHLEKSPRHAAVLRLVAEKAGVAEPGRGRGYALHESFGSIVAMAADVSVSDSGELKVHRIVSAVDCGDVVHPDTVIGQMEGGIIFGLTAAQFGKITFLRGMTEQSNFDGYPLLTLAQTPDIQVHIIRSGAAIGGIGEVAVPPVAPAIGNAIFNITQVRARSLPFADQTLATEEMMLRAKRTADVQQETAAAEGAPPPPTDAVPAQ
jgi:isoquinoline 1-oxidoreductase subunit beta